MTITATITLRDESGVVLCEQTGPVFQPMQWKTHPDKPLLHAEVLADYSIYGFTYTPIVVMKIRR